MRAVPAPVRNKIQVVYTAHSIPLSMASTCDYVQQLQEVRKLVSTGLGRTDDALVYQSRSGPPGQAWLEPDVVDYLREVNQRSLASAVVLGPVGFIFGHIEVGYYLVVGGRPIFDSLRFAMVRGQSG